jgi:hypothetical protein
VPVERLRADPQVRSSFNPRQVAARRRRHRRDFLGVIDQPVDRGVDQRARVVDQRTAAGRDQAPFGGVELAAAGCHAGQP